MRKISLLFFCVPLFAGVFPDPNLKILRAAVRRWTMKAQKRENSREKLKIPEPILEETESQQGDEIPHTIPQAVTPPPASPTFTPIHLVCAVALIAVLGKGYDRLHDNQLVKERPNDQKLLFSSN